MGCSSAKSVYFVQSYSQLPRTDSHKGARNTSKPAAALCRPRTHTHAPLSTHTTTHNMPLGRCINRKGKDELRWSWVVARATCPLHELLHVGDGPKLHLLERHDKMGKMINMMVLMSTGEGRSSHCRTAP